MDCERRPAQYIVRVWSERRGNMEFRPWAHSAEDAKFQIENEFKYYPAQLTYIGPLNPNCKCLNECRCGVLAQ